MAVGIYTHLVLWDGLGIVETAESEGPGKGHAAQLLLLGATFWWPWSHGDGGGDKFSTELSQKRCMDVGES